MHGESFHFRNFAFFNSTTDFGENIIRALIFKKGRIVPELVDRYRRKCEMWNVVLKGGKIQNEDKLLANLHLSARYQTQIVKGVRKRRLST